MMKKEEENENMKKTKMMVSKKAHDKEEWKWTET